MIYVGSALVAPDRAESFFAPLILPALEHLVLDGNWGTDSAPLCNLLRRSACSLRELEMLNARFNDLGLILELSPSLTSLEIPLSYLPSHTITKIALDEWGPGLQYLECSVHAEDGKLFFEMLERKWALLSTDEDRGILLSRVGILLAAPDPALMSASFDRAEALSRRFTPREVHVARREI